MDLQTRNNRFYDNLFPIFVSAFTFFSNKVIIKLIINLLRPLSIKSTHATGPNNVVLHMDPEDGIGTSKDEISSKLQTLFS